MREAGWTYYAYAPTRPFTSSELPAGFGKIGCFTGTSSLGKQTRHVLLLLLLAQTGKISTYMRTQSTAFFTDALRAHGLAIMPREAGDWQQRREAPLLLVVV